MYLISCIVFSSFHIQRILKIQKVLQEDETLKKNHSIALHLQWQCSSCACAIPFQKANDNLITAAELKWNQMPLHKVPLSCIPYFSILPL